MTVLNWKAEYSGHAINVRYQQQIFRQRSTRLRQIFSREEKEIPSSQIGEIVMESLKKLDPVAYVRFASVYREFKDVNTFMDELKKILE